MSRSRTGWMALIAVIGLASLLHASGLRTAAHVTKTAQPDGTLPGDQSVQLVQVATGLEEPINIANAGDGSGRLFVVGRRGTIRIVDDGALLARPFLDLGPWVKTDYYEQGLLGLAFHPDYTRNGRFFVYYSSFHDNGALILAEYQVTDADPNMAERTPVRTLLSIPDPHIFHNGGTITFGPDGYLYIPIGDGGGESDQFHNAQNLRSLHGKILRIDVDRADDGLAYAIPADNPFVGEEDAAPEVWAYGLRNPWQISFDREGGDIYIADVGQRKWEEINVAPADQGGQNYGWPRREGSWCYPPKARGCKTFGQSPVAEYRHGTTDCAITGIGVYRGAASPSLDGIYFSGDFCSGQIRGLSRDGDNAWVFQNLLDTTLLITGSGADEDGELYVTSVDRLLGADHAPNLGAQGAIWRIVEKGAVGQGAVIAPTATPAPVASPVARGQPNQRGSET